MGGNGDISAALDRGGTLPYAWYGDPEILRAELRLLFERSWQYVGRTDEVAEPGDSFTCRVGNVPIVVVRDGEGALRAHVNVCRHRGAEVVCGPARRTTLQCHYHAWTYDLDGWLRAAPRSERERGLRRERAGAASRPRGDLGAVRVRQRGLPQPTRSPRRWARSRA